jgi:nitrite reductase/ring-hydroxylating ferredoxin subunit
MDAISTNQSPFEGRTQFIDYQRLDKLFYLGSYTRRLPVSLTRMMENALDWAHLPFIHASTFHHMSLVEEGNWGWRAEVGSAKSAGTKRSMLELLVDVDNHYWATTVVSGIGKGIEIHTKAQAVSARLIKIEVRFYLPQRVDWFRKKLSYFYLKNQYRNLYDEDDQLMQDRQSSIDDKKRWREQTSPQDGLLFVGKVSQLDANKVHVVEAGKGRYCVALVQGQWHAYSAVCPHQLGKLDDAKIERQWEVSCPWHGYRFDVRSGENLGNHCANLHVPKTLVLDGNLFIDTIHNSTSGTPAPETALAR